MKKVVLCLFCALLITGCGKKASSNDEILVDGIEVFGEGTSSYEQLREEVEAYQKELPEDIGDGMAIIDCQLLSDEVLYVCEMDEDYYSMEDTREMRQAIKAGLAESLQEDRNNNDLRSMLQLCVQTNRGLGYQYVGDQTGITVTVHFTDKELARLLNMN